MDINTENKNLLENEDAEANSATTASQEITAQESIDEENEFSTLSVDAESIERELKYYGLTDEDASLTETEEDSEEVVSSPKKCPIQKTIIIAAVAFLLTAVIAFGTMIVYKALTKPAFIGSWSQAGDYNGSMYLKFDNDGSVSLDMGGFERYGNYTTEKVGDYDLIHTDFYELALISQNLVVTYSEDNSRMNMYFLYEGADISTVDLNAIPLESVTMGSIEFIRGNAPALTTDPADITHASADEFGVTSLETDKDILGSWQLEIMGAEGKYETYTFNADGTGSRNSDYVYYQTYGCGLGETSNFKYTVHDGKIFITYNYYDGSTQDLVIEYSLNKENLVLDGTGYEAVK